MQQVARNVTDPFDGPPVGDKLYFYYQGGGFRRGEGGPTRVCMGLAALRRDGYVGPSEEIALGGYHFAYSQPSTYAPGNGERLLEEMLDLLDEG